MTRFRRMPSSWRVALQFALAAVLVLTAWPPGPAAALPVAIGRLLVAAKFGIATPAALSMKTALGGAPIRRPGNSQRHPLFTA